MYQQSERPVFNARQVISPIHYDVINKKVEQYRILFTIHLLFQQDNKMQKTWRKVWTLKKNEMCFVRFYHYYSCRKKLKEEYFLPLFFCPKMKFHLYLMHIIIQKVNFNREMEILETQPKRLPFLLFFLFFCKCRLNFIRRKIWQ